MEIRQLKEDDLQLLYDLYDAVILHQPFDTYGAGWTKDVYPDIETLKDRIENGMFFAGFENDIIVCAGVVSLHEDEIYRKGSWIRKLEDDEIAVFHLFSVHPDYRGRGYGDRLLKYMIDEAGRHVKAIHLDFVKGNLPAGKLYEKAGFIHRGEIEVFYEDTGDILVELMEYDY